LDRRGEGWLEENDAPNEISGVESDGQGDVATVGPVDEMDRPDIERLDEGGDVGGVVGRAEPLAFVRLCAGAEISRGQGDEAVLGGDHLPDRLPRAPVGDRTMHEHNWLEQNDE
jgi:hypothetical protein